MTHLYQTGSKRDKWHARDRQLLGKQYGLVQVRTVVVKRPMQATDAEGVFVFFYYLFIYTNNFCVGLGYTTWFGGGSQPDES
jgi:hypothetical protein